MEGTGKMIHEPETVNIYIPNRYAKRAQQVNGNRAMNAIVWLMLNVAVVALAIAVTAAYLALRHWFGHVNGGCLVLPAGFAAMLLAAWAVRRAL